MEVCWKKVSDLPGALEGFSAVSVQNFGLYIFGGVDDNGLEQNQLFHFSPTNNSWRKLKSSIVAPEPRSNSSMVAKVQNGKVVIFVFGGLNCEEGWKSSVWKGTVEDASSVNWVEIKHSGEDFTARDKMTVVSGPDCCFLIGGFGPLDGVESEEEDEEEIPDSIRAERANQQAMTMGWFDEVVKFDFVTEKFDQITTKGVDGAAGKAAAGGFMDRENIFLFGGRSMKGRTDKMFSFNLKSQVWEEEKPGGFIPSARSFLASCDWNGSLLIFGGQGRSDELLGGLHRFSSGKWSKVEASPSTSSLSPRRQAQLLSFDGSVYLLGGSDKINPETGINNVLREMWVGTLGNRTAENGDNLASLGLKRKSN